MAFKREKSSSESRNENTAEGAREMCAFWGSSVRGGACGGHS